MASTTTSPHLVLKHHLAFITLYASSFAPSGGRGKNAVLPDSSFASADSGAYLMPLLLAPLIEQQQQKKVYVCVCFVESADPTNWMLGKRPECYVSMP